MRTRLLAAALVGLVAGAGPAAAGTDVDGPIGGDRLGSTGVVVDEDAPRLPEGLTAASWVVADLDSGKVLAAKDPHGRYAPASTLKTLTAVTLIPVLEPDRKVVPTFDDINVEGSKVGLVERVGYPVSELFSALMMVSGNDAANVLATAAGGQQATAALMNDKARSLHALDTRAVNPHGLDAEGQVSSSYDLALIARAGMADPAFAGYAAATRGSVSAPGSARIEMHTKNKLLKGYEGALGIKNGYTSRARASFVGAAERDGRRLVVTLMKADPKVWAEAEKLLDWGFAAAGDVDPVGKLVDAQDTAQEPVEEVTEEQLAVGPSRSDGSTEATGLGTTLGGMGLAAAALLAVRHRPRAPAP
ncbi:MAG: D-alanyl-D-alanine carboxypeptidase, partial [Frankiales bacterium]|nr:D-alanyl-D-alanine carboxypeptidase [Frankiales bacterium]